MIDNVFQDYYSQSHFGRKLLQTNTSSFDTSQPSFIALLTIISFLTFAFVITVIILCCRYYSNREKKLKRRHKHRRIQNNHPQQTAIIPFSITPTSLSNYSIGSSEQLLSEQRHQNLSINTLPSRRLQQSMIDAYLNDLNTFQPATIDVKKLKSYLFVDLHSTSSETFPNNSNNNTQTNEIQKKSRYYIKQHQSHDQRFLMRERSLPTNRHRLPQLRPITTQQQGFDDTNNSSTIIANQDLQSTTITTTTDDYDDSHAYNVKQNQLLQTIKEQRPCTIQQQFPRITLQYEREPYFFEIVSTSRDDSNDIQIPYISSPIIHKRLTYINDSIIV